MRWRTRTNGRTERGASAVEFALVMPILALVLVGIVNFAFVLAQQVSLNNAARQAARYAVVDGPVCSQIETEGKSSAATIGMSATQVPTPVISFCPTGSTTVKPCSGRPANTNITVTITRTGASNPWVISFPPFNLLAAPTLSGTGVMRCEFS
jgi:Flp pilus assembly protein TadG